MKDSCSPPTSDIPCLPSAAPPPNGSFLLISKTKLIPDNPPTGKEGNLFSLMEIFAVGMKKLISSCPPLGARPEFRQIMNLKGLDVISTRLWLDQSLSTRFPANVLAGFEPGVGGTYFNLTELQVSLLSLTLCVSLSGDYTLQGYISPLTAHSYYVLFH